MAYEQIPLELREVRQWGLFKRQWNETKQKYDKYPVDPHTGGAGKSNDESTWSDFTTALEALAKYQMDGLAFYFKPPFIGIDLDHKGDEIQRYIEGDTAQNDVWVFLNATRSYAETSMSGEGIHIIARGKIPGDRRRNIKKNVEMYGDGRFFAITGNFFGQYPQINDVPDAQMKFLYQRYVDNGNVVPMRATDTTFASHDLSTQEVIQKALESRQGKQFKALMDGAWDSYGSQSEADMAFANMLAFWTAKDFNQMDEIFRDSGMYRQKYDERHGKATYGEQLLNKAIADVNDVFTPKQVDDDDGFRLGKIPGVTVDETGTTPDKPAKWYSYDDTGNRDRFVDRYGKIVRYNTQNQEFMYYDGTKWQPDEKFMVNALLDEVIEDLKNEPIHVPADKTDDEDAVEAAEKAKMKHITRSRSDAGKRAALNQIKTRVAVVQDDFDAQTNVVNTTNGVVDLASGLLSETKPDMYFTKSTYVDFTDNVDAPQWEQFLNEIFAGNQELINFMQRLFGYALTGTLNEQVFVVLHGKGRNGKSTLTEIIEYVLDDYVTNMNPESIMVKNFSGGGANSDIARLKAARIINTQETDDGARLDESLIKRLTGGDTITARQLYGKEFEFKMTGTIFMSTNNMPIIRGTDDGIWRRLIFVPFTVQIPENKVDRNLKNKLKREAIGILNWIVDGAIMYQREGLNPPEIVKEGVREYRTESDTIGQFLDQYFKIEAGTRVETKDVYTAFDEFNDTFGTGISKNKLSREMTKRFGKSKAFGGKRYFYGLHKVQEESAIFKNTY